MDHSMKFAWILKHLTFSFIFSRVGLFGPGPTRAQLRPGPSPGPRYASLKSPSSARPLPLLFFLLRHFFLADWAGGRGAIRFLPNLVRPLLLTPPSSCPCSYFAIIFCRGWLRRRRRRRSFPRSVFNGHGSGGGSAGRHDLPRASSAFVGSCNGQHQPRPSSAFAGAHASCFALFCFATVLSCFGSGKGSGGSKICLFGGSSPFFFLQPPLSSSSLLSFLFFSLLLTSIFHGVLGSRGGWSPLSPPCRSAPACLTCRLACMGNKQPTRPCVDSIARGETLWRRSTDVNVCRFLLDASPNVVFGILDGAGAALPWILFVDGLHKRRPLQLAITQCTIFLASIKGAPTALSSEPVVRLRRPVRNRVTQLGTCCSYWFPAIEAAYFVQNFFFLKWLRAKLTVKKCLWRIFLSARQASQVLIDPPFVSKPRGTDG